MYATRKYLCLTVKPYFRGILIHTNQWGKKTFKIHWVRKSENVSKTIKSCRLKFLEIMIPGVGEHLIFLFARKDEPCVKAILCNVVSRLLKFWLPLVG